MTSPNLIFIEDDYFSKSKHCQTSFLYPTVNIILVIESQNNHVTSTKALGKCLRLYVFKNILITPHSDDL